MVEVWLPYGRTEVCARIPTRNFLGLIEPREKPGVPNPHSEIERAMNEPIGAKRLSEIVKPGDKVDIVVDDAARPTASYLTVPSILNELNSAGVTDEYVTVIFACGTHREVEAMEMKRLVGDEVLNRVKIINHDCKSTDQVYIGTTSFGTKVCVNKVFAEADVRVLTGDVGLHYYAGYGGGRKSVLPGVSNAQSIQQNHAMLLHPKAEMGVLEGNPLHEDMVEAAKLANVDFTLNVVLNSKEELVKAFAGDLNQVFDEAVKIVDEMYKVPINRKADIIVTSPGGHPFDINLYQAYKGIHSALNAVEKGGVIILVAECPEGHGHEIFYEWMTKFKNIRKIEKELQKRFVLGGHKAYYLKKALQKVHIILVSVMPDYYAVNVFNLKTAKAVNDALRDAFNLVDKNAKVLAMPYGSITLPITETTE